MVKIRFYLDCRGVEKGSVAPLKLCVYKDYVRALIPLNIHIYPKDWSAKRQRPADEDLYSLLSERKLMIKSFDLKQDAYGAFNGLKACEVKKLIVEEFFSDKKIEIPSAPPNNFQESITVQSLRTGPVYDLAAGAFLLLHSIILRMGRWVRNFPFIIITRCSEFLAGL